MFVFVEIAAIKKILRCENRHVTVNGYGIITAKDKKSHSPVIDTGFVIKSVRRYDIMMGCLQMHPT